MAQSTPLTDDTIAASEQFMETPADNDDLLLGISIFTYPGPASTGSNAAPSRVRRPRPT